MGEAHTLQLGRCSLGAWKGLPLKPCVKYLGAHLQPFDSAKLEVTLRIAAARSAFAMFSKFLRRASVPLRRKILVFNAVVNEALLSVLEVRVLIGSASLVVWTARIRQNC